MSRLIWILPKLKEKYGGRFCITPAVKMELITRPITIKRFEFEALQVMKLIKEGVLEVYDKIPQKKVDELTKLANNTFKLKNKNIDVIQSGELESVVSVLQEDADGIVMDERTLRLFIENNKEMKKLLETRFRGPISVDKVKLNSFSEKLKGIKIIRSVELISVAYKLGQLDDYVPSLKKGRETLVDSVLWTAKFNGCAITEDEINEIKKYLLEK